MPPLLSELPAHQKIHMSYGEIQQGMLWLTGSASAIITDSAAALCVIIAAITISYYCGWYRHYNYDRTKSKGTESKGKHVCQVVVTLPNWAVADYPAYLAKSYPTDVDKMTLAIELSARNVAENTGGPFGTAIFRGDQLVSIGMNRVVPLHNSTLHGETVAIQLAQRALHSFTLAPPKDNSTAPRLELFTSCEPCVMCLGATLWSGVGRLVCAATKHDAQAIGFDEGPVYESSYEHLKTQAGIEVVRGVMSKEAAEVLRKYGETGVIYNGHETS